MERAGEGWLAVESLPVGVITWYLPGGGVAALTAVWLAVVNGRPPELRAGSRGMPPACEALAAAGEFVVNIPASPEALPLPCLVDTGPLLRLVATAGISPARSVYAPLLDGYPLQLECAAGRVVPGGWEVEVAGSVRLLRRGGLVIDPAAYPDLCALRPLHAVFPS